MKLSNKTVLITGGNKGIGLEVTKLFLATECERVIVIGRDFSQFSIKNDCLEIIKCNLANVIEVDNLLKNLPKIDILINNAGVMNSLPYDNYPEDKMAMLMQLNLYTPVKMITELSKTMKEQKFGRIVSVASVAGQIGHPDVWYGISKAGVVNYTKTFARLFENDNIIINAVAPGPVETDMLAVIPEFRKAMIKDSVYSKRFAKASEIAQTIFWLASESPEYLNGSCIDLNNGLNHR
ncbi:SDR family oxidoreductase [Lentisphaerota bacterium WC36G]|nr:SDR family oxidoreductase [Lentisphaerae bacterium WC36]